MASYVADTKEETEAKNKLITLLMGVLMTQNDTTLELKPESEAILHQQCLSEATTSFKDNARARGMEAVHEFQQNEALAAQLRDTASKLTSAAAHISSPKVPAISYVPSSLKRKREENLDKVEETLLEAVRVVRDVKKAEQCYQPLEMIPLTNKDTPSAPSHSAPSTRSVIVQKISSGDLLGRQAKVARPTDPQGTIVAAATVASEAIASRKKSDQTKGPTSKEKSPDYMRKLIPTPSTCEELPTLRTSSGRRIIKPSSRRLLGIVSDHEDDSG